jgi:multiple sugar transport system substrate-binding protein
MYLIFQRVFRKWLRAWQLGLLAASLLVSTGARAEKLVVWVVGDDKAPRVLRPAVEVFKTQYPSVDVEIRDVPWADAMAKYSAALASQSGPDIVTGGTSFAIDLGAKGALLDLTQHAPDVVRMLEEFAVPGVLRALRRPDGAMHAAPFEMNVQLQYYRTDLLPAAPATWAEFDAAVHRVRAGGARGFAQQWGNTAWLGFFPYLKQAGGAVYDTQCTKALVDSPEAVRALQYYASIYRELKASTDSWPDIEGGLDTGSYPLVQSGSWQISGLEVARPRIAGRWAAAPLPAGPTGRRTAFLGGTAIGVMAYSTRKTMAFDFIRTIFRPEVALRMSEASFQLGQMWLPGGRADQLPRLSLPAAHKKALLAQIQDAEGPPNCSGWARVEYVLTRAVQRVVLANADAQTELSLAAQKMNRPLRPR